MWPRAVHVVHISYPLIYFFFKRLITMNKPRLSFWQIWNMSFGFFGIQFGFALQNANVSRIFETLGADKHAIPLLWIAAPLTGLIVQPIVGYFSDRTWCKLGRRRPYFLGGAVCASVALIGMPNSAYLWMAAVDYGCVYQCIYGAFSSFCWRYASL